MKRNLNISWDKFESLAQKSAYMVGRKSIVKKLLITNVINPGKPYWVFVQANKNHGICDIVFSEKDKPVVRLVDVLTKFQGQQFDSEVVQECLENALYNVLNANKV